MKRPNIVFIYTDQQRFDSLGCYGNQAVQTPNIDGLAADGVLFKNHFVQNPVCMPSRISMLSSRYPSNLGIGTNGIPAPENIDYIWNVLKPYDYKTANIGKLHFLPHVNRYHQDVHRTYGLDTMILSDEPGCYDDAYTKWVWENGPDELTKTRTSLPPEAHRYNHPEYAKVPRNTHEPYIFGTDQPLSHSDFVADEVCDYITRHKMDRFFAIAGFYAPHTPVNPLEKYLDRVDLDKLRMPVKGEEDKVLPFLEDVTEEEWRQVVRYYLAFVAQVDDCVGRIINKLKEEDLYEDTFIVFTSDHGEYLGDHGRIQKGWPGHEPVVKVPLIFSWPKRLEKGISLDGLVEAVDIVPTVLDYAGIQMPTSMQGISLRPYIEKKKDNHKDAVLCEMFDPRGYRGIMVRDNRYKYYRDLEGNECLYDLLVDPDELKNEVHNPKMSHIIAHMNQLMVDKQLQYSYRSINQTAAY